jgi:hypothetical protein
MHSYVEHWDGSGWSGSPSGLFLLGQKPPVPIEEDLGWAPEQFWTFRTFLAGIQPPFLCRPAP